MADNVLQMEHISISFPGVKALDDVSFTAEGGKVNCLVGENGAGKSTLIKILAGIYRKEEGSISLGGEPLHIQSLTDAKRKKINFIFQDTNLCDKLTVFQNYTLGKEQNTLGIIDKRSSYQKAVDDFQQMGVDIDLNTITSELGVAEKQIIEILKAFDEKARVIVYDEPSSSLTESETQKLFNVINILKQDGVSIIYISHRLDEIFQIGDYVTVLRNGKNVANQTMVSDLNKAKLIELIVGEGKFRDFEKDVDLEKKEVILDVNNLSTKDLHNITFNLHKGEILGVTGLLGSGFDKLGRALFGLESIDEGTIRYKGEELELSSQRNLVQKGICFIPENRREEALFGVLSVLENLSISSTENYTRNGIINKKKEMELAEKYVKMLEIKTPSVFKRIKELSGGNQQKVVISRWLSTEAQIMLLLEPTHGIDVKTKVEIYNILKDISMAGISVIVFSTEYAEIITLCSRILIMKKGRITKSLVGKEVEQQILMNYL